MIRFAGQNFEPLLSGALYWPTEQTLLVADLIFENAGKFRPARSVAATLRQRHDTASALGRHGALLRLATAFTARTNRLDFCRATAPVSSDWWTDKHFNHIKASIAPLIGHQLT